MSTEAEVKGKAEQVSEKTKKSLLSGIKNIAVIAKNFSDNVEIVKYLYKICKKAKVSLLRTKYAMTQNDTDYTLLKLNELLEAVNVIRKAKKAVANTRAIKCIGELISAIDENISDISKQDSALSNKFSANTLGSGITEVKGFIDKGVDRLKKTIGKEH